MPFGMQLPVDSAFDEAVLARPTRVVGLGRIEFRPVRPIREFAFS
jgi:hypothetical protein